MNNILLNSPQNLATFTIRSFGPFFLSLSSLDTTIVDILFGHGLDLSQVLFRGWIKALNETRFLGVFQRKLFRRLGFDTIIFQFRCWKCNIYERNRIEEPFENKFELIENVPIVELFNHQEERDRQQNDQRNVTRWRKEACPRRNTFFKAAAAAAHAHAHAHAGWEITSTSKCSRINAKNRRMSQCDATMAFPPVKGWRREIGHVTVRCKYRCSCTDRAWRVTRLSRRVLSTYM